jgi:hypothetical protein
MLKNSFFSILSGGRWIDRRFLSVLLFKKRSGSRTGAATREPKQSMDGLFRYPAKAGAP